MWCSDTASPSGKKSRLVPVNQIQQREKKNPNNIDEVPVQTDEVDRRAVFRREPALERLPNQPDQQARADDHVQGMQAGHCEIKREKQLRVRVGGHRSARLEAKIQAGNVMLDKFLVVFDALDAQEYAAENQGQDQKNRQQLFFTDLRGPYGHGHGQAAGDEHDGVDGTEREIDGAAGFTEYVGVRGTVERVSHEHAAEEQNF